MTKLASFALAAFALTLAACAVEPVPTAERVSGPMAAAQDATCDDLWGAEGGFVAWTYPPGVTGPEPFGNERCAAAGGERRRFGAEPSRMGDFGEWDWWCCPKDTAPPADCD